MKKIICIAASIMMISLTSCTKDDKGSTPEASKSKTEYLTASTWKQISITVNPGISIGGTTITDLWPLMPACMKDDTRKFNVGGSGVDNDGAIKCDPSDPQTTNFSWSFNSAQTQLIVDSSDITNIVQLDANTFKGTTTVDGSEINGTPGVNYTLTIIASH